MNYWFVFYNDEVLLEKQDDGTYTIPCQVDAPTDINADTHIMDISSTDNDVRIKAYRIDNPVQQSSRYEMCGLRKSYYKLPNKLYLKAGKCHELLYWDANTRFCGACGAPTTMHTEISKKCTKCGKTMWPQLATAIIVLIHKGDELLLVHAKNFKSNFYGLIAGFVETGETLEEAVCREVKEETSLTIKNLQYYASQPWPYPCGLMVGFYAEYESGDIHLQYSELATGGWFHKDALPTIPEKLSLARILIDHWLETHNDTK